MSGRYGGRTSRAVAQLPDGVEAIVLRGAGEVVYWLPRARALVCGDRVHGDGHGGLTRRDLAAILEPLLELPVERVVVSHGEAVLEGGRPALAEGLEEAR